MFLYLINDCSSNKYAKAFYINGCSRMRFKL